MYKSLQKVMVLVVLVTVIMGNVSTASAADPYLTGLKFNKASLTYYVDTTPTPNVPAVYDSVNLNFAISNAVSIWNQNMSAYGINLSFTSTTSINNADIIISMGLVSMAYGRTTHDNLNSTTYSKSYVMLDDEAIYTDNIIGGTLDGGKIVEIVMHELGHAIGLAQITEGVAITNNIHSLMLESIESPYFSGNHTTFDYNNIKKMY